jgi:hypothetical protein
VTFSGRASFFKQELNTAEKRMKPIGVDSDGFNYYYIRINKDCRIYKERYDFGVELIVKNYDELEVFIAKFEGSKNSSEVNLVKAIRELLLTLKENDEEEKKREAIFIRKQQAFDKTKKLSKQSENEKYQNSDYFLMNISDHVITRNQLNQITKINIPNTTHHTRRQLRAEDVKKEKVEKERLERERRLEKRSKLLERQVEDEIVKRSIETAKRSRLIMRKRNRKRTSKLIIN